MKNSEDHEQRLGPALAKRAVGFLLLALLVGTILNQACAALEKKAGPAGFGRGVLQGALMPMAWPNLLAGRDVNIYSQRNTGVTYKLGYTTGVNLCGALFFGFLFWRLGRLRAWAREMSQSGTQLPR